MKFDEEVIGCYRLYVGALDTRLGDGHIAALVVQQVVPPLVPPRLRQPASRPAAAASATVLPRLIEVFRDDSLACGHRWQTADEALQFALRKAREWVAAQRQGSAIMDALEVAAVAQVAAERDTKQRPARSAGQRNAPIDSANDKPTDSPTDSQSNAVSADQRKRGRAAERAGQRRTARSRAASLQA